TTPASSARKRVRRWTYYHRRTRNYPTLQTSPPAELPGRGPTGHRHDAAHQHQVERLVGVLRNGSRQPTGQLVRQGRCRIAQVLQVRPYPPQPRPVLGVPVFDQQGGPWVGLEIVLP